MVVEEQLTDSEALSAADALYEAGCDDAMLGREHGSWYVLFDRPCGPGGVPPLSEALAQVRAAGLTPVGVRLIRSAPASTP